jgi:hypothetical protein
MLLGMPAPQDASGAPSEMYNASWIGPEGQPDAKHDGAPAGELPSDSELPVRATHGGPSATTGGYSASPSNEPLPAPGSCDGDGLPPTGLRK